MKVFKKKRHGPVAVYYRERHIGLNLPPELKKQLCRHAKNEDTSISEIVRVLIQEYIDSL